MLELASSFMSLLKRNDPALNVTGAPLRAVNPMESKRSEMLIGRWKGAGQSHVGCNDLNRWRLQFTGQDAPAEPDQDWGFEIYLAQIHPNDIFRELDSIKQQLLAQVPRQDSDIRMKKRDHTWIEVTVCRYFSYCQHNGELLQLDIGVFANPPLTFKATNSQNL